MESFAERIQMVSVQFVPFIMAVVFHEYAHGFVAHRWGDRTAHDAGRLTLNPVPHMDFFGTLLFPLINMFSGMNLLFGWARPVPVNPAQFRKYRPGLFWVAMAGPGMNFVMATVSAALFVMIQLWMPHEFYLYEPLAAMTRISIPLNFALGIFNLLPLPPLDGSKMVESFLPFHAARKYEALSQYSFFILIALLLSGALNVLSYPIQFCAETTLYGVVSIFHLLGAV